MRCLIIDNYDSFTWNLAHYAAEAFGVEPLVVRNDQYTWDDLQALGPFDCIIVSPGPGSVVNEQDFRISRQAVTQTTTPVLGVCLGMQGIAYFHGADITHAPIPYHGRPTLVTHNGDDLYANIPAQFNVVRYHSLMVAPPTPKDIVVTATTDSGIIMGIRHRTHPQWGVQFHPESIKTEHGHRVIENFRDLAHKHRNRTHIRPYPNHNNTDESRFPTTRVTHHTLIAQKIATAIDSESVFMTLYRDSEHAFWLDNANATRESGGFSFMGDAPGHNVRTYRLAEDTPGLAQGHRFLCDLETDLESIIVEGGDDLPFSFRGGWIGYFTYEMKALFGANNAYRNDIPDAVWMCADRFIAFDHLSGAVWAVCLANENDIDNARQWVDQCTKNILNITPCSQTKPALHRNQFTVNIHHSREEYLTAIEHCRQAINDGESYEICLTNQFHVELDVDPLTLYRHLRGKNPAPFAAFIKSGPTSILSASPERFLNVNEQGRVQSKPIKGTCSRSPDPDKDRLEAQALAESPKDRAENLMIVDLLRSDLSRVSKVCSVTVPKLMDIESFATVHQMVSTIESQLKPQCTLIDLIRATFPGGSVTGAPKLRTMEIIDKLEQKGRGVYCGTIGYLGYNRIADLNIAIRTLSHDGRRLTYGAGGAITYLSDARQEFEEVLLKSNAVLKPVWHFANGSDDPYNTRLNDHTLLVFGAEHIPG